jgi:RND family efflux transporter MFP subunit
MTARVALHGRALALGIACGIACGITACGNDPRAEAAAVPAVRPAAAALAVADSEQVDAPLSLPGQLYVENDAIVIARAAGLVEAVRADLGARVSAGQLLASLESTDQEIALARAREGADNARRVAVRQRALAAAGGSTTAELEQSESELRRADIQLRQAERDAALTRVTAPFAGMVTARMARARRLVRVGDSLFRVTASAPLLVSVRVPESSTDGIRTGAPARIVGLRGTGAAARVVRVSPAIDAGSGTREVVVQLDAAAHLVPGSSVTVRLGAERRWVTAIPRTAVSEDGYVLVWANDRSALRAVSLGASLDGGRVEVVNGLAPGETVVRTAR